MSVAVTKTAQVRDDKVKVSALRKLAIPLLRYCTAFGINPLSLLRALTGTPRYVRDGMAYSHAHSGSRFGHSLRFLYPCLTDFTAQAGVASGHYFHQDLWAARKIYQVRPRHHIDIGSRIDGFIAHLLTFMPVTIVDIRGLNNDVEGLTFVQGSAINLEGIPDESIESISSLHAVEHFGLGRYGDPIDPEAPFKAMRALVRVLRPGGKLYFSVPVGVERLEFNAHRIFAPETVVQAFAGLKLRSFAAVNDAGNYVPSASPSEMARAHYACGLFEFVKE